MPLIIEFIGGPYHQSKIVINTDWFGNDNDQIRVKGTANEYYTYEVIGDCAYYKGIEH